MRISQEWLRDWVSVSDDTESLAHQLTMAGLEVDSVEPAAPAFSGVVVGEITECEPHPDAERLRVCQVDDGSGEPKTVVCGAPNAEAGLKAPFATVGARLPGDMKIKAAKLRGVKSFGMLCAARELGLSEENDGLMPLPADAPIGTDMREYMGLDDPIIEVELTPNRADCLSMLGVAREVGVLTAQPVTAPDVSPVDAAIADRLDIRLSEPAACPRYCGRVIRGVNTQATTPMWMRERLRRAGIRPLSIAVDITNYLMLELGQPMHAFDLAKLNGAIDVRLASNGEKLTLLNGDTVELAENTLVIADAQGPVAMAGVMGGEASAVGEQTQDIFLEAAFFAPAAIAGRARQYGLHTDSSHRFERGVDPEQCVMAIERATQLLVELAGGEPGPVNAVTDTEHLPERETVALRPERVNKLLGTQLSAEQMQQTLNRLGMPPASVDGSWQVIPPSWRFDISREVDLIEEIARIHGYDQLPARRTQVPAAIPARPESRVALTRLRSLLVDRGYQEAISYSFVSAELQQLLDPAESPLALANPISADLGVMRTSLWPGLVRALQHNRNRQMQRVRLFETGLRFRGALSELQQAPMVAGLVAGPAAEQHWAEAGRDADFFDVKGDVESLLALIGQDDQIQFVAAEHPALHPGQSAQIVYADQPIGWVGALHPAVASQLDLEGPVYLFELLQSIFSEKAVPAFSAISRYPAIRRDLAIVVNETVTAQAVQDCIKAAAGEALKGVHLFDVYRGKGVSEGCKSLAIGLILQDYSRTLTDDEVDAMVQQIVAALDDQLGAGLRE